MFITESFLSASITRSLGAKFAKSASRTRLECSSVLAPGNAAEMSSPPSSTTRCCSCDIALKALSGPVAKRAIGAPFTDNAPSSTAPPTSSGISNAATDTAPARANAAPKSAAFVRPSASGRLVPTTATRCL